jgi:redox-sensitive bicupin YhaK (pirin superfamily)
MNYIIRKSNERKFFDHGWLKTYHTFSFASYYDPNHMGFQSLRVINEDRVAPEKGFGAHSHENMEIITYVLSGELAHRDSLGTVSVLKANEFQLMHAGTGITHSEFNPSKSEPVHFLQIWLLPNKEDVEPGYEQTKPKLKKNELTPVASPDGRAGSFRIYQEAVVYLAELDAGAALTLPPGKYGWLQIVSGDVAMQDTVLEHGDGVAFEKPNTITLQAKVASKILYFSF